jgi:hypothetical protein
LVFVHTRKDTGKTARTLVSHAFIFGEASPSLLDFSGIINIISLLFAIASCVEMYNSDAILVYLQK